MNDAGTLTPLGHLERLQVGERGTFRVLREAAEGGGAVVVDVEYDGQHFECVWRPPAPKRRPRRPLFEFPHKAAPEASGK